MEKKQGRARRREDLEREEMEEREEVEGIRGGEG